MVLHHVFEGLLFYTQIGQVWRRVNNSKYRLIIGDSFSNVISSQGGLEGSNGDDISRNTRDGCETGGFCSKWSMDSLFKENVDIAHVMKSQRDQTGPGKFSRLSRYFRKISICCCIQRRWTYTKEIRAARMRCQKQMMTTLRRVRVLGLERWEVSKGRRSEWVGLRAGSGSCRQVDVEEDGLEVR